MKIKNELANACFVLITCFALNALIVLHFKDIFSDQ